MFLFSRIKSDTPDTIQREVARLALQRQKLNERKEQAVAVRLEAVRELNADIAALVSVQV